MPSMIDRRLIAAAACAALPALGGCISSTTYGTGQAPELAVFSEVAGGLTGASGKKKPISYQPRAPLVMPPDGQLRQPIDAAGAEGGPWPDADADPVDGRDSGSDHETARDDITPEDARRLRPLAGLIKAAPDSRSEYTNDSQAHIKNKLATFRNRDQGKTFKAALNDAKGYNRTGRRYLTDPPEAYRTPAETAPTEFEEIDKKGKKKGFFSRLWPF